MSLAAEIRRDTEEAKRVDPEIVESPSYAKLTRWAREAEVLERLTAQSYTLLKSVVGELPKDGLLKAEVERFLAENFRG